MIWYKTLALDTGTQTKIKEDINFDDLFKICNCFYVNSLREIMSYSHYATRTYGPDLLFS
jgi:hypothetical protein